MDNWDENGVRRKEKVQSVWKKKKGRQLNVQTEKTKFFRLKVLVAKTDWQKFIVVLLWNWKKSKNDVGLEITCLIFVWISNEEWEENKK